MRKQSNLARMFRLSPKHGAIPPQDLDAEAAVLSAILLRGDCLDMVQSFLQREHFFSEANGRIYEAMQELAISGTPIDVVSVASWLRDRERLAQIGGAAYIAQLADATPSIGNVPSYGNIVFEKWRLRQLIANCQRIAAGGYGDVGDVGAYINDAEQAIYDISRSDAKQEHEQVGQILKGVFEDLVAAAERGDQITGTPTGYAKLDEKLAGLHDGDLMIVAARPGMGKTSFVLNLAVNVASPRVVGARRGEPERHEPGLGVAVFSLEMPKPQLATRVLCSEGRVDLGKLRRAALHAEDWRRLTEAASYVSQLSIWIDDTPAIGLAELRSKVRRMQAECGRPNERNVVVPRVGLVVVDYLQLMKGRDGASSREQEISEISRGLKAMAKELGVPVIALSQLNRTVESRQDKHPQLSDLRESGAIEQDADTIIFIYRRDYYDKEETPEDWRGVAELVVAKQRNGPTGTVLVGFESPYTRFNELALERYPRDFNVDS